jgi:hypothetical protein
MNFVLLKGYALLIYFLLKYIRKRSFITVNKGKVVFRKRKLVMSSEEYGYAYFIDYTIRDIDKVVARKNGAIEVQGNIFAVQLCEDGKTEHHFSKYKRVVIPPCFSDMQKLTNTLSLLCEDKQS